MAIYVIYTRAGNEEKLRDKIIDLVLLQGDEVYIPMYNRQKKYEGEYRVVTRPLFQGYVFYETEDGMALWDRLRKITDIKKLLRNGDDEVADAGAQHRDDDHAHQHAGVDGCLRGAAANLAKGRKGDFDEEFTRSDKGEH